MKKTKIETCPFDPRHRISKFRMPIHLLKCQTYRRIRESGMKIYKCKYNLSHMYPRENQLLEHEAYCSDNEEYSQNKERSEREEGNSLNNDMNENPEIECNLWRHPDTNIDQININKMAEEELKEQHNTNNNWWMTTERERGNEHTSHSSTTNEDKNQNKLLQTQYAIQLSNQNSNYLDSVEQLESIVCTESPILLDSPSIGGKRATFEQNINTPNNISHDGREVKRGKYDGYTIMDIMDELDQDHLC